MEPSTAGPSSSKESSNSGPSTSSSSGPAAVDSSGSERKDSQEPGQEVEVEVVSLLSRLKLPRPSDFVWKHKIVANSPCRKRRSRGAVDTELKTVKPKKRVKEHMKNLLTVSNGSFAVVVAKNCAWTAVVWRTIWALANIWKERKKMEWTERRPVSRTLHTHLKQ